MSNIDVDSINDLAQHIRQVNGNNDMGATKLSESILEWQAARAQGEPSSGVTALTSDLSARINRVSRRSLDGSVVMSSEEWNGIVELVEKLLTADPHPEAVQEPVGWQFYQDGKWWNGDDRIKDHKKNTQEAGFHVRDVYAAPTAQDE